MKSSIIFFVAVLALAQGQEMFMIRQRPPPVGPPDARAKTPVWGSILQWQDNFDESNQNSWDMRYVSNNQFASPGAPIFIFLGGEWTIDAGSLQSGHMYEMAQTHGAYMFYTEHRYYGQSQPTADLSVANLKYLTTDQALEDIAQFIVRIKQDLNAPDNTKVVVFGCSYAANLAIWMRQKYPQLVYAAVSSSGPVLAKIDFNEYHDVIQTSLGTRCAAVISNGVDEILRLFATGNVDQVRKDMNWCWSLNVQNRFQIEGFFMYITSKFAGQIQYANPSTIPNLCYALQNPIYWTEYERLIEYVKLPPCRQNDKSLNATSTALYEDNGRSWMYQFCTEYGYYQISWTTTSLFRKTISVDYFQNMCLNAFGPQFTAAVTAAGVAATNAKHGGLHPNVTRVVSVHGGNDPWRGLGLTADLNPEAPVFIAEGASHCADTSGLSPYDPPGLASAKLSVRSYIAYWLQQS